MMITGRATLDVGDTERCEAICALRVKYPQYERNACRRRSGHSGYSFAGVILGELWMTRRYLININPRWEPRVCTLTHRARGDRGAHKGRPYGADQVFMRRLVGRLNSGAERRDRGDGQSTSSCGGLLALSAVEARARTGGKSCLTRKSALEMDRGAFGCSRTATLNRHTGYSIRWFAKSHAMPEPYARRGFAPARAGGYDGRGSRM